MQDQTLTTSDRLADLIRSFAKAPDRARVRAIMLDGQRYWIKRREVLSLRWRLQKGNPARRFAHERAVLHDMIERGAPVPPIIAEGSDWFALPDCGDSLECILDTPNHPARTEAFARAGKALARLHALGLAHGRPHPRDLCWDGRQIRFLDFERGITGPAASWRQALDIIQMVFALHAMRPEDCPELGAFCDAYRRADQCGLWQRAQKMCHTLRWIDPLTRPIQNHERRHKPKRRYKEWQALPLTLATFAASTD